ncbi:acetyl-CoA carboxylase biotin carboxyl carrier protein [Halolactibacillus halophilus]|uniref:Biotin carboxyl carrier protein of acetyl-CoA carboxylase n=1 Tax=Halolactibacillus halophilus TaxID=306540 RepID=A0A1I5SUZ6_9BACI|nr:acetyl-CoA carboxylase biotin carboxyl carrier protein [Halolactibacillus halophilus]GEM02736.1 biotin carboxyl carrier protein of acetyl-CoA carboxylase [Halolactibacillus halophilus]SFP74559.1 acetyl-CoA carboxylase biotin carboxyl carrier protein [Halolactibacillus halophilus]
MFTIAEVKELIEALDQSTLTELAIEQDNQILKLKKDQQVMLTETAAPIQVPEAATKSAPSTPVQQTAPEQVPVEADKATYDHVIKSPMVGTFYLMSSPDSDPFVSIGDTVKDNTTVCIIEAMKLFNEIEAEVDGEIIEILAKNGELVEYNQPLFGIKTQ